MYHIIYSQRERGKGEAEIDEITLEFGLPNLVPSSIDLDSRGRSNLRNTYDIKCSFFAYVGRMS
jgi:hypothetical protein